MLPILQALFIVSPANLLETTEVYLDLSRRLEKVYVYAHMKNDQDTRVAKYQEFQSKAMSLYSLLGETFASTNQEFMEITEEQYANFLKEVPALEAYAHYLTNCSKPKSTFFSQKKKKNC